MARENLFRPASAIINEVLLDERVDENPWPSLPKPVNMARATNRMRQQLRPFLPAARILPEFQRLKDGARTASLEALVQYVENNWISSTVWPPAAWSVYMLPIRTNNDVEGWHNSLNRRANNRVHLPFYLLVELLHQEARLVFIQIKLVSDGKLSRIQRKKYRLLQSKIFKHWEDFNNDEITARRLLKLCRSVHKIWSFHVVVSQRTAMNGNETGTVEYSTELGETRFYDKSER